jgi:uncharacterized phage-associated protein
MNVLKLIKLLYLIDRKALATWGRPVTFDWYYSLPHGPILSFTLDRINTPPDPDYPTYWHEHISERQGHEVGLLRSAGTDELSPVEETLIESVYREFGHMDQYQLRDWCHLHLPEWKDPKGSRLPIEIKDILKAEGFEEDDIRDILEVLSEETLAERLR